MNFDKNIYTINNIPEMGVINIEPKARPLYTLLLTKAKKQYPNEPIEMLKIRALIQLGQGFKDMSKEEVDNLLGAD